MIHMSVNNNYTSLKCSKIVNFLEHPVFNHNQKKYRDTDIFIIYTLLGKNIITLILDLIMP